MTATVTIDRSLFREVVDELFFLEELLMRFGGRHETALTDSVRSVAHRAAQAGGLAPMSYFDETGNEPAPEWRALEDEASVSVTEYLSPPDRGEVVTS